MKLTKDYIFNHIRETKYCCWSLFVMQNYKRVPIMHYNGDDFSADDDQSAKAEKAAARLDGALQSIPPDTLLCIELRSSKGANGSQGTLGPFEFYNYNKGDAPGLPQPQPQQTAGLGGFGFVQPPPGWVSEETLNAKLEGLEVKNQQHINEILLKQREKDFEERRNRDLREIAELRKELNDEKRKYESNTGAAAETLVMAIKKILGELFPALPFAQQPAQNSAQLSGAAAVMVDDQPHDPKYNAVERLANFLYVNKDLSEKDINEISATIESRTAHAAQPAQEPAVIHFPKEAGDTQNV